MSQVAISGNASGTGTLTIAAPNTNSNYTLTLPTATTELVGTDATQTLTNKTIQGGAITSGTAVASTSGTSIDFTSIPSWVKRVTVMFSEISTNGSSPLLVQIGDSGGIEATGYIGISSVIAGANTTSPAIQTTGYYVRLLDSASTELLSGTMTINLISGTTWVSSHVCCQNIAGATPKTAHGAGTKTLSDVLDRIRITTSGGTATFDAGTINIMYEG